MIAQYDDRIEVVWMFGGKETMRTIYRVMRNPLLVRAISPAGSVVEWSYGQFAHQVEMGTIVQITPDFWTAVYSQ